MIVVTFHITSSSMYDDASVDSQFVTDFVYFGMG